MVFQAQQEDLVDAGDTGEVGFSLGGLLGGGMLSNSQPVVNDAEQTRRSEFYGWYITSPGVISAVDQLHLITDVVDGYPMAQRPQRPASMIAIPSTTSCDLRPLGDSEVLANVVIGEASVDSDLHVYSDTVMAADTAYWIGQTLLKSNFISDSDIVKDHPMPIADVIITDTSGPIYLLLQHQFGSVLWNIHLAPGVELAHVAMVARGPRAFSAPSGAYEVQALEPGGACAPGAARKPAKHWEMLTLDIGSSRDNYSDRANADFAAYDAWFRRTFGQGSEDNVVGAANVSHVLIGPAPRTPETRVPYRPISGAEVLVTGTDHIIALPKKQRVAKMMGIQRALAAKAAGGNLAMLFPEPMMRSQP